MFNLKKSLVLHISFICKNTTYYRVINTFTYRGVEYSSFSKYNLMLLSNLLSGVVINDRLALETLRNSQEKITLPTCGSEPVISHTKIYVQTTRPRRGYQINIWLYNNIYIKICMRFFRLNNTITTRLILYDILCTVIVYRNATRPSFCPYPMSIRFVTSLYFVFSAQSSLIRT